MIASEYLVRFPPTGFNPARYAIACTAGERAAMIELGGRDVTDNGGHWDGWIEQVQRDSRAVCLRADWLD